MKLSNALRQVISSIKDYVDRVMPKKLSDLEIDMELGAVKTVNGNEPDENGNVEVKSVVDFYELENKPFDCELNLLETIHVFNNNGTVRGYLQTHLFDYQYICVEINDKKFFDVEVSERTGDIDENIWSNGDGYGFYIEFKDRGVREFIIYTDTNRYGESTNVKLYEQLTKKTINPLYLPITSSNNYGVVKVDNGDEWTDWEQYAPCISSDGYVYAKTYKAANVFRELSFENLDILIDYEGNHGLFTETVVEGISNEIELTLPVHAWYIGHDYTNYSRKFLFETANGETLLLNIKNSTITKVERLAGASASSYGIVTLPSEEYPVVDNETFLSLPDGIYNYLEGIEIKLNMGEDDDGNPIINYSLIRGLFQKFNNHAFSYGTGCGFTNLYIDDESGELCATYAESLDGAGYTELEQFLNQLGLILGFDKGLTTDDKTIVGAINEVNEKVENNGGSAVFTVNLTVDEDGNIFADKTFAEVMEAVSSNKKVVAIANGMEAPLTSLDVDRIDFTYTKVDIDNRSGVCILSTCIYLWSDNTLSFKDLSKDFLDENELFKKLGDVYNLETDSKVIVDAINEVNEKVENAGGGNPTTGNVHTITKEEVIILLTETGFISPATTASGDIYTDSDGDVYVM